jgi:hypothetical protein
MAIVSVFIFFTHAKLWKDPLTGMSIGVAVVVVVFLTYFVLALAGFRVSAAGDTHAPRLLGWLVVTVVTVVVFALWFLLWARSR